MSLYADDGSLRVTIVDGTTYTGRYSADESIYVTPSTTTPDDVEGMDHPCGALIVTVAPENANISRQAANGSLYIQVSPYTSTGAQRVTIVPPSGGGGDPTPTQILLPPLFTNTNTFIGGASTPILFPNQIILPPLITNTNSFTATTISTSAPANPYHADAVHFDGLTQIHRSSFSAGTENFYTFSCWFKVESSAVGAPALWNADPDTNEDAFCQFIAGTHNLQFYYKDDSTTKRTPRMSATVNTDFFDGNWHHILVCMTAEGHPLNASRRVVYLDDVQVSPTLTTNGPGPFNILVNARPFFVGNDNQGDFFVGDMADFWWDNHTNYLSGSGFDLSFRRKFIDGGGKPVDPVNFPTGNILFSGDSTTFSTNQGTGGTFTVISGALTDASTSPSD